MRDVKLVSLSEDGSHLVLTHEGTGEQFALTIDDRVRAAVVSDRARLGQLPLDVESRLRPKEIQTRVRAGESSEDIAAAAGVSVERVLRYAGPVLAEREHVAMQAQRCAVSRHGHEGPGAVLRQMVESRLAASGVQQDTLSWDAWRTDTGHWTVSATYVRDSEEQTARFEFDPVSRIVIPDNERARLLTGDCPDPASPSSSSSSATSASAGAPFADAPSAGAGPRTWLSAVPDPDRSPAETPQTAEHDTDDTDSSAGRGTAVRPEDNEDTLDLSGLQASSNAATATPAPADPAAPDSAAPAAASDAATSDAAAAAGSDLGASAARGQAQQKDGRSRRRSKRTVVPSWDEILFGAGDSQSSE